MSFKEILVHVDSTDSSRTRLCLALGLARRFGTRLTGLHVIPEPDVPPYFKPSVVERIAKIYADNARVAATDAATLFEEEIKSADVPTHWECLTGELNEIIGERARFADLLVMGQFDTENPRTIDPFLLPAKVVFEAATPMLVVPNAGAFASVGKYVLIAWDGSREAGRAVRDALPLLQTAEHVSVLTINAFRQEHMHEGAHASDLIAHLGRHGIQAKKSEVTSDQRGVTGDLLEWVGAFGADLLVMGAYGHSRIWEFVIGGTTQDLLERTTIPVLMSR